MWIKKWSQKEIQILKNSYPNKLWESILKLFPDRNKKSISRKAEELGLKRSEVICFRQASLATKKKWKKNKNMKGRKKVKREKHICPICDKQFNVIQTKHIKFCSLECFFQFNSGSQNFNWKGGISKVKYRKFTKSLKLYIAKRDNYTCQNCGKLWTKGKKFAVHHIDYDKENSTEDNLIFLCSSCHSKTNFDRKKWIVKLKAKIEDKYRQTKHKKVWGEEIWIQNRRDYCGKKLLLKRGFRCSSHKHLKKDEVFYLIRGRILMEVDDRKWIMKPEDSVHIPPNTWHRFTGLTSAQIIEFSSHHEEDDSYRKELSGKAHLFKAYDYDGVVKTGIQAEKGAPVITSRTIDEIEKIDEETRKNHPIYFNPISLNEKTIEKEIEWKAKMITQLGIEEYFEDSPEVIVALRKLCPNCHIIKV